MGNNRGVSLLELLAGLSLISIITVGVMGALNVLNRSREAALYEMNRMALDSVGSMQIYTDLLKADTFNFLGSNLCHVTDGNYAASEATEFFVYNAAQPGCDLSTPPDSCKRKWKIQVADGEKESERMILTLQRRYTVDSAKKIQSATRTLRPTQLYDDTASNDFRVSGTLSYKESRLTDILKAYGMMKPGMVLRILSPYETRAMNSTGDGYDFSLAPRLPSIVVTVNSASKLVSDTPSWMGCQPRWGFMSGGQNQMVDSADPGVTATSDRLDSFFRMVPADGGFNGWVKVIAMEVISYQLVDSSANGRTSARLMRSTWNAAHTSADDEWVDTRIVADGLKSFSLLRANTRTPSISYEMENVRSSAIGVKNDH